MTLFFISLLKENPPLLKQKKSNLMAKVISPLFSFFASGPVNDILSFYTRSGNSFVRQKQKDPISKTSLQEDLRTLFKDASVLAKELTDNEKAYYAALNPNSAACPWWNNYIGEYIKEHWIGVGVSVKSLQYGTIDPYNAATVYHDITPVDRDKSVLIFLGNYSTAANLISSFCTLRLYSNTQIRLSRGGVSAGLLVGYMVLEFAGLLRNVDHFAITCDEINENYIDLPSFNTDKSVIFYNGFHTSNNDYKTVCGRYSIVSSTRIKVNYGAAVGFKRAWGCLCEFP